MIKKADRLLPFVVLALWRWMEGSAFAKRWGGLRLTLIWKLKFQQLILLLYDSVLPDNCLFKCLIFLLKLLNSNIQVIMSVPVHLVHKLLAAHCEPRGRDCFIFVFGVKGQVSDHYSPAITTKTVSEYTGHHAVAIGHVLAATLLTFVESDYHLFKVAQWSVDVLSFLFYLIVRVWFVDSFAARKINQVKLRGKFEVGVPVFTLQSQCENAMRAWRSLVHMSRWHLPDEIACHQ